MIGQQAYLSRRTCLPYPPLQKSGVLPFFAKLISKLFFIILEPNYIFWVAMGKILLTSLVHDELLSTSVNLERESRIKLLKFVILPFFLSPTVLSQSG